MLLKTGVLGWVPSALSVLLALSVPGCTDVGWSPFPVPFHCDHLPCIADGQGSDGCPARSLCLYDDGDYNNQTPSDKAIAVYITDLANSRPCSRDPKDHPRFTTGCGYVNLGDGVRDSSGDNGNSGIARGSFDGRTSAYVNNTPYRIEVYQRRNWKSFWDWLTAQPKPVDPEYPVFVIQPWSRAGYVTDSFNDRAAVLRVVP